MRTGILIIIIIIIISILGLNSTNPYPGLFETNMTRQNSASSQP